MLQRLANRVTARLIPVSFVAFLLVLLAWSATIPMFGSPDENAHMARSAGVARGQLTGERGTDNKLYFIAPEIIISSPPCYAFNPAKTADCLSLSADDSDRPVRTTATSYPPFLHVVSGLPTRATSGLASLYLMRFLTAVVGAGFLTTALRNTSLVPAQRPVAAVLPLALTPMVLFLSGTVNPSGLSTSAALAIWTAAFVLADPTCTRSLPRSAAAFGLPFCCFLLTRRDSLMWGAAILVVLLLLVPSRRVAVLLRERSVQLWMLIIGSTAALTYLRWTRGNADGFGGASAAGAEGNGGQAFALGLHYSREAIGVLGWLDTQLPPLVYWVWWAALAGLLFYALATAGARTVVAVVATLALVVGLTTYIGAIRYPYFQGRYYLPLAVGLPLVATYGLGSAGIERVRTRLLVSGFAIVFVCQQLAFAQQLRRYAVGATGSWFFVWDHQWEPTTGPMWLLMTGYAAASTMLLFVIGSVALRDHSDAA